MATANCKNCNQPLAAAYCAHCGQKASVGTITLPYLLHDIPHSVFHVDSGFLYTLKWMFINPGKAIKNYLSGQRVRHFKPFAYVIILSTICTLVIPPIEQLTYHFFTEKNPNYSAEVKQIFWEKYISLLIFLMIPFSSFITWISFRKRGYNYWEHVVGNTYLAAQINILLLVIELFSLVKTLLGYHPNVKFTGFMILLAAYYTYCLRVWMGGGQNWWRMAGKLFLTTFLVIMVFLTGFSLTGIMTPWWGFSF